MIDFHAHILPGIDDGAKDLATSVDMLRMLKGQGVSTVVCSPHFYPGQEAVDSFLSKREDKLCLLLDEKRNLLEDLPDIIAGAEVYFFRTIYSLDDIERLCIEGTNLLLLEMPFEKWTESIIESVHKLISNRGIIPIIAHVDRYIAFGNGEKEIKKLRNFGALIQINSDFTDSFMLKRKVFSYLKKSLVDVLGSDCHSTGVRKSHLGEAVELIEKQFGRGFVRKIKAESSEILKNAIRR